MEQNCKKGSNSPLFKTVTILLLSIIAIGIGYLAYIDITDRICLDELPAYGCSFEEPPTVEEALEIRADQMEQWRCERVYENIPAFIMQKIFETIGTQQSIKTYVYEYEANEEAYINLYVADKAKLSVDDKTYKRIKDVEIKTTLNDEISEDRFIDIKPIKSDTIQ